jgi:hypothetical protein
MIENQAMSTIANYPIKAQGLMTLTNAISIHNKALIMNTNISIFLPEIISILVLTTIYFAIGAFVFQPKHIKFT